MQLKTVKFKKKNLAVLVAAFIIIGSVLLFKIYAAGPEASFEAENASLTGSVSVGNDVNASGGRFIQFANTTTGGGGGTLNTTFTDTAAFPEPAWNNSTNHEGGRVDAIRRVGDTIYVGGNFTVAQDTSTSTNVTRNYLAAINASTGKLLPWNPDANGRIYDIEPSADGSTLYVAGSFSTIGGVTRHGLAALDPVTGAVKSSLPDMNFNSFVWVIRIYGNTLYAGGQFSGGIAKIDLSTSPASRVSSWNPTFNGSGSSPVKDIVLVPGTNRLVVGGWFTSANGSSTSYITAIDSGGNGASLSWSSHPGQPVLNLDYYAPNNTLLAGTVSDTVTSFNATTGAENWALHTDGNVQAITIFGNSVIAGMHGDCIAGKPGEAAVRYQNSNTCKSSGTPDGLVRHKIFKIDAATGIPDNNWGPSLNGGTSLGVWALDADTGAVYGGGDFVTVDGQSQPRFVKFVTH